MAMSDDQPFILAISSITGGVGCTTLCLGLSWLMGEAGRRVSIVDPSAFGDAERLAQGVDGRCSWKNVQVIRAVRNNIRLSAQDEVTFLDANPLGDSFCGSWIEHADALVLVSGSDVASLRGLARASVAVRRLRQRRPALQFVGVVLSECRGPFRRELLELVASDQLVFSASYPWLRELRDWPIRPGSPLPPTARVVFSTLLSELEQRTGSFRAHREEVIERQP
jgi:hypothetical protein